ncbi:MAG: class I SAM-dependent methyltransferase [Candidatus Micrarchaeota archaeon]|nr:class I SAM-dependent methyltransferase [Candidatus Micrarchaeota archaeon]
MKLNYRVLMSSDGNYAQIFHDFRDRRIVVELGSCINTKPVEDLFLHRFNLQQDGNWHNSPITWYTYIIRPKPNSHTDTLGTYSHCNVAFEPLVDENKRYIAVDKSFGVMKTYFYFLKNKFGKQGTKNIFGVVADANELPFKKGCIDCIFGNNSIDSILELANDPDKIWSNVNYVLKQGGCVSCVTCTPEDAKKWHAEFEKHGFRTRVADAVIMGNKEHQPDFFSHP